MDPQDPLHDSSALKNSVFLSKKHLQFAGVFLGRHKNQAAIDVDCLIDPLNQV